MGRSMSDFAVRCLITKADYCHSVSLKTKLSAADVHRLVCDVRRRVEHEVTFEGTERRVDFLSTLLPSTPETTQHVLTQGGFGSDAYGLPPSTAPGLYPPTYDAYGQPSDAHGHLSDAYGHPSDASVSSRPASPPSYPPQPYPPRQESSSSLASHPSPPKPSNYHLPPNQQSPPHQHSPQQLPNQHSPQHAQNSHPHPTNPHPHPTDPHPHLTNSHPTNPHPHLADPAFTALVAETQRTVRSADFAYALEAGLDRATEMLIAGLETGVYKAEGESSRGMGAQADDHRPNAEDVRPDTQDDHRPDADDVRVRLAGLLPGLARWSSLALTGLPNELVDALLGAREVSALSAIVFARFEEGV